MFPKKIFALEQTCLSIAARTRPWLPVSSSSTASRQAASFTTSCSWQYVNGGPFHCSEKDKQKGEACLHILKILVMDDAIRKMILRYSMKSWMKHEAD